MSRTVIRGGCVLTLGDRTTNHVRADVLVEDGRIAEVGTGVRARDAEVVEASDAIVMPGFVDAHRHLAGSLFRNTGDPGQLSFAEHFSDDDAYAATLLGLLSSAEAGTTTVVDWCDTGGSESRLAAVAQAHADSGLRTVLVAARGSGETDAWGRLLHEKRSGDLSNLAAGSDEPGAAPDADVVRQWELARSAGVRVHAHAGSNDTAVGSIRRLADRLGADVTLVHCTRLSDDDLDAVASSGAGVVVAPSEEMAGGIGMPPVQRLIDRQIRPGLGVGRETLAPGDLFAQMRAVISVQHASYFDLKLAGKAGLPNLLNTRDTIKLGTSYGAAAVGLGNVTGSIEPGKAADLIVLRTDRPNIWPINDPIGAVVWGMDTSNLDWVFVGGEAVMREGSLVADTADARRLALDAQRGVAERSGLLQPAGDV